MDCYFQDIEHHIISHIEKAKSRLLICVAWFTNETIGVEIIKKKNVDVEIVIDDNEINRNCVNLKKLKAENYEVTFIKNLNKHYYLMHNKFCVIDNNTVITGSYNWTKNANTNDENISVIIDKSIAAYYSQEFRRIKDIEFPADNISMTETEAEEITNLIYNGLISTLKTSIYKGKPNAGLIVNWADDKILNKIRVTNERVRNTLHKKVGTLGVYFDLIQTYGIEFKTLSTESEKVQARDNFNKEGLDEIDLYLTKQFSFFKIKAIKKLQENYAKLMDSSVEDEEKFAKIYNVFIYLNNEKIAITKDLNLNII
ncbi:phospholipase D-like domain-containing protein [Fulvivirgaceae bacterium LMO-SS25]